jgi:hypothetical protein
VRMHTAARTPCHTRGRSVKTQRPAMSQTKLAGNQRASNTTAAAALQNRKFSSALHRF